MSSKVKRILIVDDEKTNRTLYSAIFRKHNNIETLTAENGREAIEILKKENYNFDLILLDIYMPEKNGIDFLKERLTIPELLEIPIFVLSTDDTKKREAESLAIERFYNKGSHSVIELSEDILDFLNKKVF